MPLYIKVQGVSPEDLTPAAERGPPQDQSTSLANDVFRLLDETHDLDPEGVATVVNRDIHDRLRAAEHDGSAVEMPLDDE